MSEPRLTRQGVRDLNVVGPPRASHRPRSGDQLRFARIVPPCSHDRLRVVEVDSYTDDGIYTTREFRPRCLDCGLFLC